MQQQYQTETKSGLEYLRVNNQKNKAVILLHGYGASMFDLYSLHEFITSAGEYDWYFPNAPLELMPGHLMGRAWFPIDVQELESAMMKGEYRQFADKDPREFESAIDKVETFINNLPGNYSEINLGGFSQGAMVCSHLALRKDIHINKLFLFSGALIARDKLLAGKFNHQIDFFQSHGQHDPILEYAQGKDLFEALKLMGLKGEFVSFSGAHEIPLEVLRKWDQFF